LDPELVQIQDKLQQLRDHLTTDEDKTSSKILKLQDSIHQFEAIETEIARYLTADSPRLLTTVQQAVKDLQTRIAELEAELVQLGKTVAEAEGNIANMKALERNVADNLRWREMGKEIEKMRTEIKELERQGAEVEVERYQEQAEKLRKAHNKWTAEVHPPLFLPPPSFCLLGVSKVVLIRTASDYGGRDQTNGCTIAKVQ
jgi:chromosome segregation ATPase